MGDKSQYVIYAHFEEIYPTGFSSTTSIFEDGEVVSVFRANKIPGEVRREDAHDSCSGSSARAGVKIFVDSDPTDVVFLVNEYYKGTKRIELIFPEDFSVDKQKEIVESLRDEFGENIKRFVESKSNFFLRADEQC